ncbi:importin-5-like [Olea europaea subsp. europaea]|uniref:Importin-5-like n=1 Tax=Olea europaea subsp. europaea TaxID=158383 RepID=A0A8S0PUE5_OLEEU|nr:importin-5-like [Olea europaea subsp. europaea]
MHNLQVQREDSGQSPLLQVVPAWLSCLPIKGDLIEAKVVHEQLCTMVERSDRELLGPNNQYLPKIVAVFAKVSSHYMISE